MPNPFPIDKSRFPGFGSAILVLLAFFLLQLFITGVLVVVGFRESLKDPVNASVVALGALCLLIFWLMRFTGQSWPKILHESSSSVKAVVTVLSVPIALLVIGITILMLDVDAIIMRLVPPSKEQLQLYQRLAQGGIRTVILFCLIAPVLEETLFRGIFLRSFLKQYPPNVAIGLSALVFAVAHLNVYQGVTAVLIGLLFGWLYVRTQSLWPSILAHGIYNGAALAWTAWAMDDAGVTGINATKVPDFGVQVAGVILVAVGATLLRRLLQPSLVREPESSDT